MKLDFSCCTKLMMLWLHCVNSVACTQLASHCASGAPEILHSSIYFAAELAQSMLCVRHKRGLKYCAPIEDYDSNDEENAIPSVGSYR